MRYLLFLALYIITSFQVATATTIDFNDYTGSDAIGPTYTEDGFTLTAPNFRAITSTDNKYTGTISIYNSATDGLTTLTANDGLSFDLTSIELANFNNHGSTNEVVFTADTGAMQSWTVPNGVGIDLTRFTFGIDFLGISSVSWRNTYPHHSFDNIVIDRIAPAPEPGTMLLFGLGILGFAGVSRRRKQ